jgi:lipopolysaccharide biosynthesis glycosyltransferase
MLNSGLLVINPSTAVFNKIQKVMNSAQVDKYDFPDQGLLSDVFAGRWVVLPYVYNALKPLRWEGVHSAIWQDDQVKVVHYIFATKPWHQERANKARKSSGTSNGSSSSNGNVYTTANGNSLPLKTSQASDELLNRWWWAANDDRQRTETEAGINDGF